MKNILWCCWCHLWLCAGEDAQGRGPDVGEVEGRGGGLVAAGTQEPRAPVLILIVTLLIRGSGGGGRLVEVSHWLLLPPGPVAVLLRRGDTVQRGQGRVQVGGDLGDLQYSTVQHSTVQYSTVQLGDLLLQPV